MGRGGERRREARRREEKRGEGRRGGLGEERKSRCPPGSVSPAWLHKLSLTTVSPQCTAHISENEDGTAAMMYTVK